MSGLNQVNLIGRLGADPEVRYLASGDAVANLSVATSESWKDKTSGERVEQTEWHKVAVFGKAAEIAAEYLGKGSEVGIVGKLQTRKWQDKDGNNRYTTEIKVDAFSGRLVLIGGKRDSAQSIRAATNDDRLAQRRPAAPAQQAADSFDDDIPF